MATTEPPVCLPCVRLSSRLCPPLRPGAVAVRVRHASIRGVQGMRYRSSGLLPVAVEDALLPYGDAGIRWVKAAKLVRELHDCTIIPLETLGRG